MLRGARTPSNISGTPKSGRTNTRLNASTPRGQERRRQRRRRRRRRRRRKRRRRRLRRSRRRRQWRQRHRGRGTRQGRAGGTTRVSRLLNGDNRREGSDVRDTKLGKTRRERSRGYWGRGSKEQGRGNRETS
ncbi:hypothetical protein CLOP_g7125, partial [Closterium sp. NIES-67]